MIIVIEDHLAWFSPRFPIFKHAPRLTLAEKISRITRRVLGLIHNILNRMVYHEFSYISTNTALILIEKIRSRDSLTGFPRGFLCWTKHCIYTNNGNLVIDLFHWIFSDFTLKLEVNFPAAFFYKQWVGFETTWTSQERNMARRSCIRAALYFLLCVIFFRRWVSA